MCWATVFFKGHGDSRSRTQHLRLGSLRGPLDVWFPVGKESPRRGAAGSSEQQTSVGTWRIKGPKRGVVRPFKRKRCHACVDPQLKED